MGARGEGKIFSSTEEVRIAYDSQEVEEQARVKVRIDGDMIDTTVGRVILSEVLPAKYAFFACESTYDEKGADEIG